MNYDAFSDLLGGTWYERVQVECQVAGCNKTETRMKGSALENFKRNGGIFKCRSCSFTKEGRKKISKATSYKRSAKTKKKMSESATKKWETDWGKKQKKVLSRKTSQQHSNTNLDKSKRKVLYISAKNNGEIRVCNSSGEFIACEDILEKDPTVVSYETQVYYEFNDRCRSLDFLVYYTDGRKKVIEVKPKKRINEEANALQLDDSEQYAEENGWGFEIWTEKELGITSWKIATQRADAYRKKHYEIDYASYRAELDRKKGRRHYQTRIATDKVVIFCDFCNDYHTRLRKTYEKNVQKNGRYVCIRENGSVVGKKPRKKRESPYGPDKKRCTGPCDRVLPKESFSAGKTKCKECRADFYKKKYQEKKGIK